VASQICTTSRHSLLHQHEQHPVMSFKKIVCEVNFPVLLFPFHSMQARTRFAALLHSLMNTGQNCIERLVMSIRPVELSSSSVSQTRSSPTSSNPLSSHIYHGFICGLVSFDLFTFPILQPSVQSPSSPIVSRAPCTILQSAWNPQSCLPIGYIAILSF